MLHAHKIRLYPNNVQATYFFKGYLNPHQEEVENDERHCKPTEI